MSRPRELCHPYHKVKMKRTFIINPKSYRGWQSWNVGKVTPVDGRPIGLLSDSVCLTWWERAVSEPYIGAVIMVIVITTKSILWSSGRDFYTLPLFLKTDSFDDANFVVDVGTGCLRCDNRVAASAYGVGILMTFGFQCLAHILLLWYCFVKYCVKCLVCETVWYRDDFRFAPSQWDTALLVTTSLIGWVQS